MMHGLAFLLLGSLFDQSIAALLGKQFPDPAVSYIVLDSATGKLLAQRWDRADRPVPVGSLVKPFVAMAASPDGKFPVFTCNPKQCWLARGHGRMEITAAIQHSCNSYFLQLAPGANADFLSRFGLTPPPSNASAETWIGLGREWKLPPISVAQAYRMLASYPQAQPIREGMIQSARSGTGKAFGGGAMVKTGTAACSHLAGQPGDGYVVAFTAKYTLLVQMHAAPGATTAATGGKMLRAILNGK